MEFHGTLGAPISMTRAVPWNSMEFRWHEQFHGIPWNFGCANFADMSSSMEFHGIPWNLECANFADTSSSMEFHGNRSVPISLTRAVPWNSIELRMRQFRWHEQFHGIPWNSMELGVRLFRWHEKFYGITWNYMEFGVRQFRWHEQFHGIPWNSMELRMGQLRWHELVEFVETGAGHVSYIPNSETQYIVITKSGYLISKLPFFMGISCNNTATVAQPVRHFRSRGAARRQGSSLQESCPLAMRAETHEWLPRVLLVTAERGSAPSPLYPSEWATSGIATHWVVGDSNQPVAAITGMRVVNSAVPRVHLSPHLSSSSQSIN